MKEIQPRVAALMGKAAATRVLGLRNIAYGQRDQMIETTIPFAVPDTSGLNGHWEKDRHLGACAAENLIATYGG